MLENNYGLEIKSMEKYDNIISWLNNLTKTPKARFIKFDITKFYPTITENVFQITIYI